MNYFVLIYDRRAQQLLELREFPIEDRPAADALRLEQERRAFREGLDQDIVLFLAASREALRETHGSYFFTERELLDRLREAAEAS